MYERKRIIIILLIQKERKGIIKTIPFVRVSSWKLILLSYNTSVKGPIHYQPVENRNGAPPPLPHIMGTFIYIEQLFHFGLIKWRKQYASWPSFRRRIPRWPSSLAHVQHPPFRTYNFVYMLRRSNQLCSFSLRAKSKVIYEHWFGGSIIYQSWVDFLLFKFS